MKLIIGLGNPGEKYRDNRHSVGLWVVDSLRSMVYGKKSWSEFKNSKAVVCRLNAVDVLLAKSTTFMNDSGGFVKKLLSQHPSIPVSSIYVVHDDLDISLGKYKIQLGVGPKIHNGIASIEEKLGTKGFWRVRIGVENRKTHGKPSGYDYVLEDFTEDEKEIIDGAIKKLLIDLINLISKQ